MVEYKSSISKQSERTKSSFKKAFIDLIHEKGYSHVTVTDIIKRADYNRTTFYLHFQDKQCLTDELQREMFKQVKEKSMNKYEKGKAISITEMDPKSFELTHFIYYEQAYFNLLLKNDTIPGLHRDLPKAIYEVLEESFILSAINQLDINYSVHKLYMAHGTAGLLVNWIENGYDVSPDDMSLRLIQILHSFAKEFSIATKNKNTPPI